MNSYNPFVCDFATKEKIAKGMSDIQLNYAISDCMECIRLEINPNKYLDEISVYRKELNNRKNKKGSKVT